ncbi:MAG: response regulator transcription factor [Verrucomicrobiota bacterium]
MKVLIAEDDLRTRNALSGILADEGYDVSSAATGIITLELFERFKPDIVCLDIMMPEKSGFDVCREIRSLDRKCGILFISAKSDEMDTVLGLELGADDFIVKPFGKKAVVARIRALTRRILNQRQSDGATSGMETFFMEDLKIDPAQLRAFRGDEKIELSPRDISILSLLYQKKGEAVSRDELLAKCWGFDFLPNSRCLDQHISQLRKRIERNPRSPRCIRTVHGVGYRFDHSSE